MKVNILEVKSQLSKRVQAAREGEDVVIARNGVPVARLLPFREPCGLNGWGRLKNAGRIDDAFPAETQAAVVHLLEGKR